MFLIETSLCAISCGRCVASCDPCGVCHVLISLVMSYVIWPMTSPLIHWLHIIQLTIPIYGYSKNTTRSFPNKPYYCSINTCAERACQTDRVESIQICTTPLAIMLLEPQWLILCTEHIQHALSGKHQLSAYHHNQLCPKAARVYTAKCTLHIQRQSSCIFVTQNTSRLGIGLNDLHMISSPDPPGMST